MAKSRGLGRGFDSLIPTDLPTDLPVDLPAAVKPAAGTAIQEVPLDKVKPNPHQPRTQFDMAELESLAQSIKQHGILHPPVVSARDDGSYELVAGERRIRAAKLAGLKAVPVIIRSFDEQQKLELALLENLQRAELNPVETAVAYHKLMEEFNLTLDQVAARMGKAKSTVANTLRLLTLPSAAREAVAQGTISEAHGRAILAVADPEKREELLRRITSEGLSVRQAEAYARDTKVPAGNAAAKPSGSRTAGAGSSQSANYVAEDLGEYLGAKVTVQPRAKGGRLIVEYYSEEELRRIVETIKAESDSV